MASGSSFLLSGYTDFKITTLASLNLALFVSVWAAYRLIGEFVSEDDRSPIEQDLIDEINAINSNSPINVGIERVAYDFRSGGSLILDHKTNATDVSQLVNEVENVAEVFAIVFVENRYPCEELNVDLLNDYGFSVGSYFIKSDWANQYNRGKKSQPEYINGITDTLRMEFDSSGFLTTSDMASMRLQIEGSKDGSREESAIRSDQSDIPTNDTLERIKDPELNTDMQIESTNYSQNKDYTSEEIQYRLQNINPSPFLQFVMKLWEKQGWTIESEDQQKNIGIDFRARKEVDCLILKIAVEVKRYRNDDKVGTPTIRRHVGRVKNLHSDYIPVLITSSSFTTSARNEAQKLNAQLIGGKEIADIIQINEFHEFLNQYSQSLAKETLKSDKISSIKVPAADNFGLLNKVLIAVSQGHNTKNKISEFLDRTTSYQVSARQADYYGASGVLLGFLEETSVEEDGISIRKWLLTSAGQEYISAAIEDQDDKSKELLQNAIRNVLIIQRVLDKLEVEGQLTRNEVDQFVTQETDLGKTAASRRSITVLAWLTQLPEVEQIGDNQNDHILYNDCQVPTFRGKTIDEILKQGESEDVEFKERLPRRPIHIAREVAAMANTGGGLLVIGVKDDSEIVGRSNHDEPGVLFDIIIDNISPPIKPDVSIEKVGDDEIMVVEVPGYGQRPCEVKGQYYLRRGTMIFEAAFDDMDESFDH